MNDTSNTVRTGKIKGHSSMNPLQVAFLHPDPIGTTRPGPSAVVWDMARELVDLGHAAHVVVPNQNWEAKTESISLHTFKVPPTYNKWFGGQIWLAKRLADKCSKLQVDILHTPEYLTSAVLKKLYPDKNVVLTVPGNIYQRLAEKDGNQSTFLFTQVIKWAARVSAQHCDSILAFSTEMYDWWEKIGASRDRLVTIPYGVDISHFYPRLNSRQFLGLDTSTFLFLFVGRLDKEKGIFDLIEAFRQIKDETDTNGKQVALELIGDGALRDEIRQQIEAAGLRQHVRMRGAIPRRLLPYWYSAADILILPSWIEPFGRVMLESMACGTPVISSDTGGPRDHIRHGYNGLLFSRRNTFELIKEMKGVLTNPDKLKSMANNAKKYVDGQLSWHAITNKIVQEIYLPLVSGT